MAAENSGYLSIDELVANLDAASAIQQLAPDAQIIRAGKEIRTRCFLICGKTAPTGERALSVNAAHPAKFFKCHQQYGEGCTGKSGNFVSLVSLATGGPEKPKGDDFKRVREIIRRLVEGEVIGQEQAPQPPAKATKETKRKEPKFNQPLAEHDNERARGIADLWQKLSLDESTMTPAASRYKRQRPFLSEEARELFRFGWLGNDTGGDRTGGTMRGKWVYAIKNANGQIVAYAGRDPEYEAKQTAWIQNNREGNEPVKWRFPKSFQRGIELYGSDLLDVEQHGPKLRRFGLPVVEGPNDVIALRMRHQMPAVGILSNQATEDQIDRIAELAHQVANGLATILLDCDEQGDAGAVTLAAELSKQCRVQRAWSQEMHGGQFQGKQPEHLSSEEIRLLGKHLARRRGNT